MCRREFRIQTLFQVSRSPRLSAPEPLHLLELLELLEVSASFYHLVDGIEGLLKTQTLQTAAGLDLPQSVSVGGQTQLIRNLMKTRTLSRSLPTCKLVLALSLPLVWSWRLAGRSYWPEP